MRAGVQLRPFRLNEGVRRDHTAERSAAYRARDDRGGLVCCTPLQVELPGVDGRGRCSREDSAVSNGELRQVAELRASSSIEVRPRVREHLEIAKRRYRVPDRHGREAATKVNGEWSRLVCPAD